MRAIEQRGILLLYVHINPKSWGVAMLALLNFLHLPSCKSLRFIVDHVTIPHMLFFYHYNHHG